MSARIFMSLSEEQLVKFESARNALGMNRSRYLQYLINGQTELRPAPIKYRELIHVLSDIDNQIKVLILKDTLSDQEKLLLFLKLEEIKELVSGKVDPGDASYINE